MDWILVLLGFGTVSASKSSLSSVSYFNNFTKVTKEAVKVLYLPHNSLTSLEGIEGFKNVWALHVGDNNLEDISAIKFLTGIKNLKLPNNQISNLNCLDDLNNLRVCVIYKNPNVVSLATFVKNKAFLWYLNAELSGLLDFSSNNFWEQKDENNKTNLIKLGEISNLYIDATYSLLFSNKNTIQLTANNTTEEFAVLKNNVYVTNLDFKQNKKISDTKIKEILPTLSNLEYLNLDDTNITDLNWLDSVSDKTKLKGISINNTNITDISKLKNFTQLKFIRCNGDKLIIYKSGDVTFNTNMETIINRVSQYSWGCSSTIFSYYWGGFVCWSDNLLRQLKNFTGLTNFFFFCEGASASSLTESVDLSRNTNFGMISVYTRGVTYKLPDSVSVINTVGPNYFIVNNSSNLTSVGRDGAPFITTNKISTTGKVDLNLNSNSDVTLSNFKSFLGTNIKSIYWEPYTNVRNFNSQDISDCVNTISMNFNPYIGYVNLVRLDGKDFPAFTNDFSLEMHNFCLKKFDNINYIHNLVKLNLSKNNFADLTSFIDKQSESKLITIDLRDNLLSNYFSYTDSSEKNVTISTCQFLLGYKDLTTIYLDGNTELTDFSKLIEAGFNEFRDEPIYKSDGVTLDHYYRHVGDEYASGSHNFEKGTTSRNIY